ncbi:translesion DNA synthesis-associated protein ImuA [Massilia genomosp. 1]|uniref:translesion DNA synthesis-associated protein ImuA n=1 Tax=Massilia genomosp. 1 TaxID=2609280 RepID=UPI001E5A4724|nr:translesion DNA synthesis-associated protein ImuA [Massilia genomosp. 1]
MQRRKCVPTRHPTLSNQLSGNGRPTGSLIDLLVQQAGIGEMRMLAPALKTVANRRVVLLQPPHPPQTISLSHLGLAPSQVLWVKSGKFPNALWAAEQVLRSGSCGALLFWAPHVRPESLRRLHLAAQAGETSFFVLRPLAAAHDVSPAPLRLILRAAVGGIDIGFIKRRRPQRDEPLFLALDGPGNAAVRPHTPV